MLGLITVAVNQGLITLAFAGVEVNLVLFSKSVLRQTNAEAANMFSRWMGTTYCFSLLGAFLSDSYLGRYLTCVIFQLVFIVVSQPLLLLLDSPTSLRTQVRRFFWQNELPHNLYSLFSFWNSWIFSSSVLRAYFLNCTHL